MKKNLFIPESGRTLIEMLGVLSIMGIISIISVKMYHTAIHKHRANELIYETQKRATMVASQIIAGQDTLSVGGFQDPVGYTFSVDKKNAKQFNISIIGISTDVCTQMKSAIGTGSAIREISADCGILTFNNDLSNKDEVQVPTVPCDIDPNTCLSHALVTGECACAPAADNTRCTQWNTNECGKGKFCHFTNPTGCHDNQQGEGKCETIASSDYDSTTINGHEYVGSEYGFDWWSAYSWCKAFNKTLISLADLNCPTQPECVGWGAECDHPCIENGDMWYRMPSSGSWTIDMDPRDPTCAAHYTIFSNETIDTARRNFDNNGALCKEDS